MDPGVTSNGSGEFKQGSYIAFYCATNDMILLVAECMSNGKWYPDPLKLECDASQKRGTLQMN